MSKVTTEKLLRFIKNNRPVVFVVLLAFFLRVWGVYPGFPSDQPNEGKSYQTAIYMLFHFLKPDGFDYPAGYPLIHLIIYLILPLPIMLFKLFFFHPFVVLAFFKNPVPFLTSHKAFIFGERSIYALYWSRYIGSFVATGSVVLTYIISKKLFNKTVAFFAAFFLAVNFRHVLGSLMALPDSHSSFFFLLSFLATLLLLEKNTRKRYLLAGISIGVSLSMKYQPFAIFPFLVVHCIWAIKKRNFLYLFYKDFLLAVFLSFLSFLLINPYYLFNLKEVIRRNSQDYAIYGIGHLGLHPYSYFYLYHWGIGHLPSIAILLGMVLMLFSAPKKFLLLFSFVFPVFFVLFVYSNSGIYPHNFIIVIPFLMIFAGYLCNFFFGILRKIHFLPSQFLIIIISLLLILINLFSMRDSFTLVYFYSRPWNITILSQWLSKSMPSNITTRNYSLYANLDEVYKKKHIVEKEWDYTSGPHSLAEFQEEGTNFAILNSTELQSITYWWRLRDEPFLFLKYYNVPFDFIESSFYGLSIKELRQYTVYEVYKPWQAQSERNYIVFKIPQKPKEIGNRIASFAFNDKERGWKPVGILGKTQIVGGWINSVGNNSNGALVISEGSETEERLASPPIEILPDKFYTVKGWLKSEHKGKPEERDGFIRIDFYSNKNDTVKAGLGESVAISARAFKTGDWTQEQASMLSPKDASYITVSFQRRSFTSVKGGPDPIYLDDVEIFETDKVPEEPFKEVPYIKSTIPLESIYYNSFM